MKVRAKKSNTKKKTRKPIQVSFGFWDYLALGILAITLILVAVGVTQNAWGCTIKQSNFGQTVSTSKYWTMQDFYDKAVTGWSKSGLITATQVFSYFTLAGVVGSIILRVLCGFFKVPKAVNYAVAAFTGVFAILALSFGYGVASACRTQLIEALGIAESLGINKALSIYPVAGIWLTAVGGVIACVVMLPALNFGKK